MMPSLTSGNAKCAVGPGTQRHRWTIVSPYVDVWASGSMVKHGRCRAHRIYFGGQCYELRSPPQTLKSHASASSAPPPKAKPFTTATVGMGSACSMTVLSGFHSSLSKREESITHRLAGRQDRAWTALKACLSSLTNSEVSF